GGGGADGVAVGAVGVDVGHRGRVAADRLHVAVAPGDLPARGDVLGGVGAGVDATEAEGVGRALVHRAGPADGELGRDVVHRHGQGVGVEGAVVVGGGGRDGVGVGPAGEVVRGRGRVAAEGGRTAVAPGDRPARRHVVAGVDRVDRGGQVDRV